MLCCVGLFAGVIAGAYLGVPWAPYLAIPLGAAGGLLGDITIFRAFERKRESKEQQQTAIGKPCSAAILNLKRKKKQDQIVVVAESR
ncbi:hypothetical protein NVIE_012700 [Nitrososphaera viennensis EN76]|uniref:Uncharacterized protein n=1 Tax=Nitrososphaera viennensis EN76 TaxID=926571 RepID=A0A060HFX2_9ARCH|nr:hypothetical protein NVIE_012700 [Nitrososphaera viennensis EN76]